MDHYLENLILWQWDEIEIWLGVEFMPRDIKNQTVIAEDSQVVSFFLT
jgi:hypothetical protein